MKDLPNSNGEFAEEFAPDSDLGFLPNESNTLAREFTRPAFTFKGRALHPFTHGMELLLVQVTDLNQDSLLFQWLAFVFLHLVRDPKLSPIDDRKRHILPLAWNVAAFRAALIAWLDEVGLSDDDKLEARRIFDAMRAGAERAAVEVAPARGRKKKPAASRRTKPRSSSPPSPAA
ncbi:MAG TPA: hypothetical protein VHW03_04575 [Chthoniobacterales bacterium]|jgi:hypothetical protein|nr:hypothetical protein [Chthoniobacterales bacterium]